MKRTIHLNESKLRQIIESSVRKHIKEAQNESMNKKIDKIVNETVYKHLNEMDWKTYANAEKKARKRGNASYQREKGVQGFDAYSKAADERLRAKRFGDAAKKAFNRDYGYKKGKRWDNNYAEVKLGGDFDAAEEFSPHAIGLKDKGYGEPAEYEYGRNQHNWKKEAPEEFFQNNPDAAQAFKTSDAEVKNYKKGNYDYDSEKGWHLKESKINNLIKETISQYLKEHWDTIKDIKDIHKSSKSPKYKNKDVEDDNEEEDSLEKMTY